MGFIEQKDNQGVRGGHGTVVLPRRNPYQLIGLRRPSKDGGIRVKPF